MHQSKVEQFRAHLTLPKSVHSITSSDYTALSGQIRLLCKSENITPSFDPENDEAVTIFLSDSQGMPLGEIVRHKTWVQTSVTNVIQTRRQKAA